MRDAVVMSAVVGLLAMATPACVRPGQDAVTKLRYAIQDHLEHLRWKRFAAAEGQVLPERIREFRAKRSKKADEVVELDVVGIELAPEKKRAVVRVVRKWYALPSNVVQTQSFADVWIYKSGDWWWAGEEIVLSR